MDAAKMWTACQDTCTFAGPVHALTEEHPALPIRLLEESEAPEIMVSYRMTFADAPPSHPPETDASTTS